MYADTLLVVLLSDQDSRLVGEHMNHMHQDDPEAFNLVPCRWASLGR